MHRVRPTQCRGGFAALAALLSAALLSACATAPPPVAVPAEAPLARLEGVVASNDKYVVDMPCAGETYSALAESWLGTEARQWEIAEFNGPRIEPGKALTIPLKTATRPA